MPGVVPIRWRAATLLAALALAPLARGDTDGPCPGHEE